MQEWRSGALVPTSQKSQGLETPQIMGECVTPPCGWEWDPGPGVKCLIAREDHKFHNRIQSTPHAYRMHSNELWEPQSTRDYRNSASQGYHQGITIIWESPTRLFSCRKVATFPSRIFLHSYVKLACMWEGNAIVFCKAKSAKLPFRKSPGLFRNGHCDNSGGHR